MTGGSGMVLDLMPVPPKPVAARFFAVLADFWALTMPEINLLVLVATFMGFCLGSPAQIKGPQLLLLTQTPLGTRRGRAEPVFRARIRCADEEDCEAAYPWRRGEALVGPWVRDSAGTRRSYLSRGGRQRIRGVPCRRYARRLPVCVHPAETDNSPLHISWRRSRCDAAALSGWAAAAGNLTYPA